jgi:hypothetical protein
MPKKLAPSEGKAQERAALLPGHPPAASGAELFSRLVQWATERVLPEA